MPLVLVRNPWVIAAAALALVAGAIIAVVLMLPSGSSGERVEQVYPGSPAASASPRTPTPTPTVRSVLGGGATEVPTPPVYIAAIARLRIPSIGVDAPVQEKGIDASNTMENPDGPESVAWYNFTAKPGIGAGNAAFSGHVDYINYGKAVFGDIDELVEGDLIEVVLEDGTVVQFAVTASQLYTVSDIPMAEVLAPTSTESVTLITCGGTFSAGAYTHRLVVRATRTGVVPVES
jgi:LPXTG-site transpeptidase (sortase) family protein